jgi:hypothetical protein
MYFGAASHNGNGCGLGVSSKAKEVHGGRLWVQCCDDCRRLTVGVWGCSVGLWVLKVPLHLGRAFLRRCGSIVLQFGADVGDCYMLLREVVPPL